MRTLTQVLLFLFIHAGFAVPGYPMQTATGRSDKGVVVCFRFDDYSERSDTAFELKLLNEFERHSVPFTLGVIPFVVDGSAMDRKQMPVIPLGDEKAQLLKTAMNSNGVEVALHGYSHQTVTRRWTGDFSEFNGLDYTSQALRIEAGKRHLEEKFGTRITTFIPPFDNFDSVTTRVVEDFGFEAFSANMDQRADIVRGSKLKFLPATTIIGDLRSAVESALLLPDTQSTIVVLLHRRDFPSGRDTTGAEQLGELPKLLEWLGQTEGVKIVTLQEAARQAKDLSAERFLGFYDRFLLRLIPRALQQAFKFPVGVYYSDPGSVLRLKMLLSVTILYLGIGLAAFAVVVAGSAFLPKPNWIRLIAIYATPVCIVLLLAYDMRNLVIRNRSAMVMAALFGIYAGIWKSWRVRRSDSLQH